MEPFRSFFRTVVLVSVCSCASAPPNGPDISVDQLSSLGNVALSVSSSALDVQSARDAMSPANAALMAAKAPFLFVGALWNIIGLGIEASVESAADRQSTREVESALGQYDPADTLANLFAAEIAKRPVFALKRSAHAEYAALAKEGYDAVIKLDIEEVSLRGAPEKLRLFMRVSGDLIDLDNQETIWHQTETILGTEEHPLSEYIAEGGVRFRHISDDLLQRAAIRLSADIIYT